jgi:hypothetical protein
MPRPPGTLMVTTRPKQQDPNLPHASPVADARSLRFVINPLVTHVRAHRQSALDFIVERFKEHRVTTVGEEHAPSFSASSPENGCVRTFFRDLCQALHADANARMRYVVFELDEAAMVQRLGPWQNVVLPVGVVNRKAHWLAEGSFQPAFREIFRALSRMPEDQVEVVLIDQRVGGLAYGAPFPDPADYPRLSLERDTAAARNFERDVLARLGDDRALVYYGFAHLREGPAVENDSDSGITARTFIRQIIEGDNGLSADDIYTAITAFAGSGRPRGPYSAQPLRDEVPHGPQRLRVYDLVRAEFPDEINLGFDLDEARYAVLPIDRSHNYPLGQRYDGFLFFRDLNLWDGRTQPPAASVALPDAVPDLSITGVIPMWAAPGSTIFVYGFVLTADTAVTVRTRGPNGQITSYPCTNVVLINENVLSATVPSPGGFPVRGQEASVQLSRPNMPPDHDPADPIELLGAFRYVIG